MRRKDRVVADLEGQLAILEQCPVCRVAINDPASGVPYLVPLNFGMAAGPQSLTLYFHCAPVGTKLDLLRADPNVSFEADCPGTVSGGATSCTYGMNYQSVIGRGTVRFVEGGEKLTALQALMQHYHCPDLPFEPEMVEHTTVMALDEAAMTGKRPILIWFVKTWLPGYLSPHWMAKNLTAAALPSICATRHCAAAQRMPLCCRWCWNAAMRAARI